MNDDSNHQLLLYYVVYVYYVYLAPEASGPKQQKPAINLIFFVRGEMKQTLLGFGQVVKTSICRKL